MSLLRKLGHCYVLRIVLIPYLVKELQLDSVIFRI